MDTEKSSFIHPTHNRYLCSEYILDCSVTCPKWVDCRSDSRIVRSFFTCPTGGFWGMPPGLARGPSVCEASRYSSFSFHSLITPTTMMIIVTVTLNSICHVWHHGWDAHNLVIIFIDNRSIQYKVHDTIEYCWDSLPISGAIPAFIWDYRMSLDHLDEFSFVSKYM